MTETKNNNGLKVLAGLLGVVLLGTIIYTVSLYQDKKKTTAALTQEKQLVVEDLNSLKSEYDKAILESNVTNEELVTARDNIAKYIDSVKTMKADISALSRYRRQVSVLKKEREQQTTAWRQNMRNSGYNSRSLPAALEAAGAAQILTKKFACAETR